MDRNSVIGLSLIMVIMVGYFFLTRDNVDEIEAAKRRQDSIAMVRNSSDSALNAAEMAKIAAATAATQNDTTNASDTNKTVTPAGVFGRFAQGESELVTIENDLIKVQLATKGGHPYSVELKNYKRVKSKEDTTKRPLMLFEGIESKFNISFITKDGFTDSTARLYFTPSAKNVTVSGDSGIITLKLAVSDNQYLEQIYWLKPNSYELFYTVRMVGLNNLLSANQRFMQLDWQVAMPLQEPSLDAEKKASTIYYRGLDEEVDNISETSYKEEKPVGGLQWFSFKQKFFNSTLIALNDDGFSGASLKTEELANPDYVKLVKASTILTSTGENTQNINMKFYFGPNKYEELKKLDLGMDRLVSLGWGIFGWINKGMILPLFKYLSKVTGNYGIIILLMTLIIKGLLFGLVYKSYISSAKMRILKPEIDELKAKHGDNLQKFQQEQMGLYKKAGVSPLGGCLPMVLQMPFLIAMFQFFPNSIELRQQSFLWAFDLSTFDSIWNFGKIPLIDSIYGDHVSLFTLLMTVSTLIYTLLNNQMTGVSGQMKYIGYIMPIFFLGFFNNYASGLTYYYFLTNVISIGQQFIMRRFVDEDALHRKIQENKKKPVKKSAFQQRLEDMAKKRGIDPSMNNNNKRK
jgi:YidC/Oxa1 family membrane protein insertase